MKFEDPKGSFEIGIKNKKGKEIKVNLELKYKKILFFHPIGKQGSYPNLCLTVIEAREKKNPKNRERVHWKLITDLEVNSFHKAVEKIRWYSLRWKIETFHKILKLGCKVEKSKLRTAERIVKLIAVFCIISWRIFWMTMLNRVSPESPPQIALNRLEIDLLNRVIKATLTSILKEKHLSYYLIKIAKLGGYLARKHDPPPGNIVMWRGLSRLIDIELGFLIGNNCG